MKNRLLLLTTVFAIYMLPSCSSPVEKYIHNELTTEIWQNQLLPESIAQESRRMTTELLNFSKDSSDNARALIEKNRNRMWQLDNYERFVDKYLAFYKKALKGDMSAADEYEDLLESAENLSEKISDAQNELSPAQLSRYMKITQKMTNVLDD